MQIQHSPQFMIARQPRQVGLVVYLTQHLRLRGRPHQSFLHAAADSFHTGVMAETLRAKIERKSTMSLKRGHFDP